MCDQGDINRSRFIIKSAIGIIIAVGGVRIFNTIVPIAKLYMEWEGLKYGIHKLQALQIFLENDFMIVIKWLSSP